jgi:hypothetical protein
MKEYGVRWTEFNRRDELVQKEKFFDTEKKRDKYIEKLEQKDNFYRIEAYHN